MTVKAGKLKELLKTMKRIESDGFPTEERAKSYFQEKEAVLDEMGSLVCALEDDYTGELSALKASVASLKESLKKDSENPNTLSRFDFLYRLGKTIAGVWMGNQASLGELKAIPNIKSESWMNPKDIRWETGKGWIGKDLVGTPMGDVATNDQYLINPIYENQIMTDAMRRSIMMGLVSDRPMTGPSIFLPQRDRGGVILNWLTTYGQQITDSKPEMGNRVELKAYTLAGFIPWFDEFEEDVYAELGKMFIEEFTESYGSEFDRQCLTASSDPFTGAMSCSDIESHFIKSSSPFGISYLDFREAVLKVPPEERRRCAWFIHESVLCRVTSMIDGEGRPIWRGPNDSRPGSIDGYPYHECDILPQAGDVVKNAPFAIFMDPKRIKHGNRKGIELKRFDGTSESLKYGEIFLRFRKRDGFLVTRSKNNMVTLKCRS